MKKEYEKPEIQCYKIDVDSIMNELSVPKNPGDSTDEQCSKKFDFEFFNTKKGLLREQGCRWSQILQK
jgi:hypothetical protein